MFELIYTILCISCLCMGFFVGFKIGTGKEDEIKLPNLNPIEKIKEVKRNREEDKEIVELNKVLENLDNYDGTGANQKEV